MGYFLTVLAEIEQQELAPPAATGHLEVVSSGTPIRDLFKHAQTVQGAARPVWDYRAHLPAPVWKGSLFAAGARKDTEQETQPVSDMRRPWVPSTVCGLFCSAVLLPSCASSGWVHQPGGRRSLRGWGR